MSLRLRQRRDRVVLFRLTENEHKTLEELCAAKGGRSLSEFVRIEVLNPARSVDVEPLRAMVGAMERRLLNLEGLHDELARRIEASRGTQRDVGMSAGKGGEA